MAQIEMTEHRKKQKSFCCRKRDFFFLQFIFRNFPVYFYKLERPSELKRIYICMYSLSGCMEKVVYFLGKAPSFHRFKMRPLSELAPLNYPWA